MTIIETSKYKKSYKKKLVNKNKTKEVERIENIKSIIIMSNNFHELLISEYKKVYYIEKKKGNLKEFYTARINDKIRLLMKPIGEYPYKDIEIEEILFDDIDNKHYGIVGKVL